MTPPTGLWEDAVLDFLGRSPQVQPSELADAVNAAVRPLETAITIYLVDLEQRALRPTPESGKPTPAALPIDESLAGRAFMSVTPLTAPGPQRRLWVPLLDGTERLGVLGVTLPDWLDPDDPQVREGASRLAGLIGHLVAAKTVYGDTLRRIRYSQPLSTASELLWRLAPPLTFAMDQMVISAVLEPCYEVGGDAFDYAVDGDVARVAIVDAAGRGLDAGLTSAVALSAMRTARAQGHGLLGVARAVDEAITGAFSDRRFATAVLADFDLATGIVRYVNAGHPPPVLLRGGKAVGVFDRGRRMPLGLGDPATEIAEQTLEPGDRLLLYTDGFTEARDEHGEEFGLHRLVDFAERHMATGLPVPETLRRLSHDVLDHQYGPLRDDATLLLISWSEADSRRTLL